MIESVTFGLVLVVLVAWVIAWGLVAAVIATSKGQDAVGGFVQGMTFGPIGVLFVALSHQSVTRSSSRPEKGLDTTKGTTKVEPRRSDGLYS